MGGGAGGGHCLTGGRCVCMGGVGSRCGRRWGGTVSADAAAEKRKSAPGPGESNPATRTAREAAVDPLPPERCLRALRGDMHGRLRLLFRAQRRHARFSQEGGCARMRKETAERSKETAAHARGTWLPAHLSVRRGDGRRRRAVRARPAAPSFRAEPRLIRRPSNRPHRRRAARRGRGKPRDARSAPRT